MRPKSLFKTAAATIDKYEMLRVGESVVVAVSGGPDSTALLLTLVGLSEKYELHLHVWHLNHLIRPEAGSEAEHVRALADRLGLDCSVEEVDVKSFSRENRVSVQEAGRIVRYDRLREVCDAIAGDRLAIGHNADDNAETVLINLTRGTGLAGLAGIPPVDGIVIRPLIECERTIIEEFLYDQKVGFIVDPSNQDKRYLRNRVRLDVLPELKAANPALVRKWVDMAAVFREEERVISELVEARTKALLKICRGEVRISRDALRILSPALGLRVIRSALVEVAGSQINLDYRKVSAIYGEALKSGRRLELGRGLTSECDTRDVIIYRTKTSFDAIVIDEHGGEFAIDDGRLSVTIAPVGEVALPAGRGSIAADADLIDWPLTVRPWKAGDWFMPLGMTGRKKLSDFFTDNKIARRYRHQLPVFADKNKIVAVADLRLDERVRLTKATKRVAVIASKPTTALSKVYSAGAREY